MKFDRIRGFTLVELMITIAVLAILISLAAPSLSDTLDKRRIIGAAEAIYSQMQFARSEAIKSGRDIKLSYTSGTTWCSGMREDDGTTCNCTQTNPTNSAACAILGDGSTRVLKTLSVSNFENISLAVQDVNGVAATTPRLEFDNVRATLDTGAGDVRRVLVTSTQSARTIRVDVNLIGRVSMCSPSANYVAGYPTC